MYNYSNGAPNVVSVFKQFENGHKYSLTAVYPGPLFKNGGGLIYGSSVYDWV